MLLVINVTVTDSLERIVLLEVSSDGSTVVRVWKVGKVVLPNVYDCILSGFNRSHAVDQL